MLNRTMSQVVGRLSLTAALLTGCTGQSLFPAGRSVPLDGPIADAGRTVTEVLAAPTQLATVSLDAGDSRADGAPIIEYRWEMNGDLLGTGEQIAVELPPGNHEITLTVIDAEQRRDMDDVLVRVDPNGNQVRLSIEIDGGGFTLPPAGESTQTFAETIRLQAVADPGFRFLRWSGDISSNASSTTVLLDRPLAVRAEFTPVVPELLPQFNLPFAAGETFRVSQGNNGTFSHAERFAWDFPMPTGTPILAARGGRVIEFLDTGEREDAFIIEDGAVANFVMIDHGEGLYGLYAHLDTGGVVVEPGQLVAEGQLIGYSGNTGFSTAPHLHFEVFDTDSMSVPVGFAEVDRPGGVALEGDVVVSNNVVPVEPETDFTPSRLPVNAFQENNIELFGDTIPAFFYESQRDYHVTGRVTDNNTRVCVALVEPDDFETIFCELAEVESDRTFDLTFRFPPELEGTFYMGIISGSGGAEGFAPREIRIAPPDIEADRPVAIITPPVPTRIDFLQDATLSGIESFSPLGRRLSFQWVQVSGPPAVIAEPEAPETQFYVDLGPGNERVAFQLTVSDVERISLADEVAFSLPDTFLVSRIGVAEQVCLQPFLCPNNDGATPTISLDTQVLQGWAEVLNAEVGDVFTFTVTNPEGEQVLSQQQRVDDQPFTLSFWRFIFDVFDVEPLPGPWTGALRRNGEVEATIIFRVGS